MAHVGESASIEKLATHARSFTTVQGIAVGILALSFACAGVERSDFRCL